jgi:hypothetical protein
VQINQIKNILRCLYTNNFIDKKIFAAAQYAELKPVGKYNHNLYILLETYGILCGHRKNHPVKEEIHSCASCVVPRPFSATAGC